MIWCALGLLAMGCGPDPTGYAPATGMAAYGRCLDRRTLEVVQPDGGVTLTDCSDPRGCTQVLGDAPICYVLDVDGGPRLPLDGLGGVQR